MRDVIEQFRDAIRSAGLIPPDMIEPDGKLHRFSSNGKRSDDAGWYVFHDDGIPAGAFGDWRGGLSESWRADIGRKLTPVEDAAHRAKVEAMRKQREAEEVKTKAEAKTKASTIWKAAQPAGADHPYLVRKRVSPVETLREIDAGAVAAILRYSPKQSGEVLTGRLLVAPVKVGDKLSTAELIDEAGHKSAVFRGAKAGGYWAAQPLPEGDGLTLLIGEGVATVLSAKEASGYPSIAALSAGNLPAVAKAMRERYPTAALVILADLVKSTGEADPHAIEAARSVSALLAIPNFGAERPENATDFNDMAAHRGAEAVARAIATAERQPDTASVPAGDSVSRNIDDATIERLAALSPLDYDRVRREEAEALGVRTETLDAQIKRSRRDDQEEPVGLFPEVKPWPSEINGAELLDSLSGIFRRFCVLPEHAATALALWVLFTHCIEKANVAPILALTSPEKRCGKSTVLDALSRLVHKPLPSSNITSAALFRAVEAWGPTLLIDEADTFLRDSDELRGVINSGHTRASAFVLRTVEVAGNHEPRQFTTWCAKVIALIGNLPDTIADRSIRIGMQRKLPAQKIERLRHARKELFEDLQSQCARFAKDASFGIPAIPESLNDRAGDSWEPLLAIADASGGKWPAIARHAAMALSGDTDESDSIRVQLLTDIKAIFEDKKTDRLPSAALVESLSSMEERPWPEYSHGKPLTARQLAKLLKAFGIVPVSIRREDGSTPKGYHLEKFSDAFARYIPHSDPPQSHNPSPERVSSENTTATAPPLLRMEKTPKPATGAACVGVADRKQVQGRAVGDDALSILRRRTGLDPVEVRL